MPTMNILPQQTSGYAFKGSINVFMVGGVTLSLWDVFECIRGSFPNTLVEYFLLIYLLEFATLSTLLGVHRLIKWARKTL